MKNPQRSSARKAANQRQVQYLEETTETIPTGEKDGDGNPVEITRRIKDRPKFLKWLRSKVGGNATERAAMKDDGRKVGAPYQRVQHRAGGR